MAVESSWRHSRGDVRLEVLESHTAPAQMAGYLWQLERTLLWLLEAPPGSRVGVESLDDVSIVDGTGKLVTLEQDKFTTTSSGNLGDSSENLWRTIGYWMSAAAGGEFDPGRVSLYLVTTAVVRRGLALELSDAKDDPAAASVLSKLRARAAAVPHRTAATAVLTCPDAVALQVVRAVVLLHGQSPRDDLSARLRRTQLVFADAPDKADLVANGLRGWLGKRLIDDTTAHKQCWIHREDFIRQFMAQLGSITSRRIAEAVERVVSPEDVQTNQTSVFVRQLRLVDSDDETVIEAIGDFLKSSAQRTKWAEDGSVALRDLDVFDQALKDRWRLIYRRHCRDCPPDPSSEVRAGREVLDESMDHRERLARQETECYYTTRGRYHALADIPEVGWHPHFPERLSTEGVA